MQTEWLALINLLLNILKSGLRFGLVFIKGSFLGLASLALYMTLPACSPERALNPQVVPSKHDHSHDNPKESGFYVDPARIRKADKVVEKRNFVSATDESPCDDLHAYVCKEVESKFELPEGQSEYIFSLFDSAKKIKDRRNAEFLRMSEEKHSDEPLAKMYHAYVQSCLNVPARIQEEQALVANLKSELDQLHTKQELFEHLSHQLASIEFSLVSMNLRPNLENPRVTDIFLDYRHLMSLQRKEIYLREDLLDRYHGIVRRFFEKIGYADFEERAQEMVSFERAIALEHVSARDARDVYSAHRPIAPQELIDLYPYFGLQNFFSELPEGTVVHDLVGDQLRSFHRLLQDVDLRVLKDMTLYHSLNEELEFFTPQVRAARQQLLREFLAVDLPPEPVIAERCSAEAYDLFLRNVDFKIIDEMFSDFDKLAFDRMIEQVRQQLIKRMKDNTWISDEGRKGAITKLEKMSFLSAKPEREKDWDKLPLLSFQNTTYLGNRKLISQADFERQMNELGQENMGLWPRSPLEVNAFYLPQRNQFVIPIGILQPPLYDPNAPVHQNLGGIGVVIGHEIGHGVDPLGSRFDELGRMRDWMTPEDRETFTKNARGLKKYFSTLGEDPDRTHNENIADLSGLNVAFDTAFDGGGMIEQKRDFFVQYAKLWCNVMTPERRKEKLETDSHAQTPARINVPVSHMDGFHEAFQCQEGDGLYITPSERVKIW